MTTPPPNRPEFALAALGRWELHRLNGKPMAWRRAVDKPRLTLKGVPFKGQDALGPVDLDCQDIPADVGCLFRETMRDLDSLSIHRK